MEIRWTDAALEKINGKLPNQEGVFCLKYETEGCGCIVSGVTNLYFVKDTSPEEVKWETNAYPVFLNKYHEIFLDDKLIIDYSSTTNSFQLKSPNQYLNPMMNVIIPKAL